MALPFIYAAPDSKRLSFLPCVTGALLLHWTAFADAFRIRNRRVTRRTRKEVRPVIHVLPTCSLCCPRCLLAKLPLVLGE
jgi:hypothetical protein